MRIHGYRACRPAPLGPVWVNIDSQAPNRAAHPEFADALFRAAKNGVHIWAYDCLVTENTMKVDQLIPIALS